MARFIKPAAKVEPPGGIGTVLRFEQDMGGYPALTEFLVEEWWDEKTRREPGRMWFFLDAGQLKAGLGDRDGERVAFVTAMSLEGLLDAAERGLAEGSLSWRPDKQGPRGRKP